METMEIWCIVNEDEAPRKFTIEKKQLEHISNSQVEAWISQELGSVIKWWA